MTTTPKTKQSRRPLRVLLRILAGILCLILLAALTMFVIPLTERVTGTPAAGAADWMADLDDSLPLNEIVLPGVHDCGTQYVQLSFFSKCQALSVGDQLAAGARYLDVRLGAEDGRLKLMHGFTSCKIGPMPWADSLWLETVLEACESFLTAHPTETVVFAVKQEHGSEPVEVFETLLQETVGARRDLWLLTDQIPTLGEARGKLVLLRRYEDAAGLGADGGLSFLWENQKGSEDPSLSLVQVDNGAYRLWVQDRYEYNTEDKWNAFRKGLSDPAVAREDLAVHFLSTKGTLAYGHPYAFAKTLNQRLLELDPGALRGWIVVDFLSPALAEHIYSANFQ